MTRADFRFGLHVVGPTHAPRRPVDLPRLLAAAAAADPPFDPAAEQYATAFRFDRAVLAHLRANGGSSAGFAGPVWSPVLHFDFDAADGVDAALFAERKAASFLLHRYPEFGDDALGLYYSGGRSVHIELPLTPAPAPGPRFHTAARVLAERLSALAGVPGVGGVAFDRGNYDRVRLWRLVNSRHPRTGLHKVRLSYDELMGLNADGVRKLAAGPRPYGPAAHPARRSGPGRGLGRGHRCRGRRGGGEGRSAGGGRRGRRTGQTQPEDPRLHPGRCRLRRPAPATVQRGCQPGRVRVPAEAGGGPAPARRPRLRAGPGRRPPADRLRVGRRSAAVHGRGLTCPHPPSPR